MTEGIARFERDLAVYRRGRRVDPPGGGRDEPRLVFVHGSMDRAATFVKAIRLLPEYDTVRFDRRGYGRSGAAPLADSVAGQVDDVLALVGDEPCVLVGHSLGGVLALAATQRRPELVRSVVVFEAPLSWEPWWPSDTAGGQAVEASRTEGIEAAAERFMRRMVGDEKWESLPEATRRSRRVEGRTLVTELRSVREGPVPYAPESVPRPLVVGYGDRSEPQHQRSSRELAARAPDAELVVIEGAGHQAPSSHPHAFAALVRQGIERARQ